MLSLAIFVATRTFHGTTQFSTSVHSNSLHAVRQHMDRDAVRWTTPIAKIEVAESPEFHLRVAPAVPPLRSVTLEEKLYNRPPPTC